MLKNPYIKNNWTNSFDYKGTYKRQMRGKSDWQRLEDIDINLIEKFLRKKKLENITKS